MRRFLVCLIPLLASVASPAAEREPDSASDGVRLVLFVVVDQLSADLLARYRPLLEDGLGRLAAESADFAAARHGHAATYTATGYATLATGVHPRRHGIVGNRWFDRATGEEVEAVDDPEHDESPWRLLAPTLGDRMKQADPRSRVFAIGAKDRAALFTAGRRADGAFWFDDEDGRFETSSYFGPGPAWLEAERRDPVADRAFGRTWEPLPATVEAATRHRLASLDRGEIVDRFPHPLGQASLGPDEAFYHALYRSPFMDAALADFARLLIESEDLGGDAHPDFLGIAFSALDSVGHRYGPDSPEVLDTLLRVDRTLGELLDFLDRRVGLERIIVSLSSDHGTASIPEVAARSDPWAWRYGAAEVRCFQRVEAELDRRFGARRWVRHGFTLDRESISAAELPAVEEAVGELLEGCPGVLRVWTRSELEGEAPGGEMAALFHNSFHPERSADFSVLFDPQTMPRLGVETTHGSPWPHDRRVPWLLRVPSGRAGRIDEVVLTVDVAPTLAALLGLPLEGFDGAARRLPGG